MHLISKAFVKLFILVGVSGVLVYIIIAIHSFHTAFFTLTELKKIEDEMKQEHQIVYQIKQRFPLDLKYILLWRMQSSLNNLEGQKSFIEQKCSFMNCYITDNRGLLNDDYTNFEAIVFNINDVKYWNPTLLPKNRSPRQKYILFGNMSSDNNPICSNESDNFFNWTWTYKLNSDIVSPFIEIRDVNGTIVGPKADMSWNICTRTLPHKLKEKLKTKSKAVAWISSKCVTNNNRIVYVKELKKLLKNYNLNLDIYGSCGSSYCSNTSRKDCAKMIQREYYFYIALEDSSAEDYVTKELLMALNNYAVPIVFSKNNYSR